MANVKSNNVKNPPFNWENATSRWTPSVSETFAQEWGLTPLVFEWLQKRGDIGYCSCAKYSQRCLAIPFRDADGKVFRAQCRAPKRDQNGHAAWVFEPSTDKLGRPIPPWIVGDPRTAVRVFVFESHKDQIAFIDRGGFMPDVDDKLTAFVSTCGASGIRRLETIGWAGNVEIFLVPQNDKGGQDWLTKVLRILSGYAPRVLTVPAPHKDFGEWAQDGLTQDELLDLIDAAPQGKAEPEGKETHQAGKGQKSGSNSQQPPPEFEQGESISWYAAQPINDGDTLLGDRYLCRTGGMIVVAPSGLGKSTLSIQMGILWSCGKPAFGIIPKRALRILIIQSEDDQGDCTEMAQMIDHLGLTDDQKKQVRTNTELIRCNDLVGSRFIKALDDRLRKAEEQGASFDLVIINPFCVYLGADTVDAQACTEFLNEWLNPVLLKYRVAAIFIHHTPKTNLRNYDKYKVWDWMYEGSGRAEITNWARAMLVVMPVTDDMRVYRFIAAKRGSRIGWSNGFDRYFAWSSIPGVLRWEDASAAQVASAKAQANGRNPVDLDKALKEVPLIDPEWKPTVVKKIQQACKCGEKRAEQALEELILSGRAFQVDLPGTKNRGQSKQGVSRTQPSTP
jgi:hypothetical protein